MKSASRLRSAGLAAAIAAAAAIPALTAAGGAAMAGTASGTAPFQTRIDQVNAGSSAAAGLAAASRHVVAWGLDDFGQLGDGTSTNASTPVTVKLPKGVKVTQMRGGCFHTLAVTSKGHVLAWGYNFFGQLGNGTTTDSHTPVRVRLPKGTRATAISAGHNFSLARTSSGHALAWGLGAAGQLGNGTTDGISDVPVRVQLPKGSKVKILAAGDSYALASTSSGLYAWGANDLGQFGDGTTTGSDTPVIVPILVRGPSLGHLVSLAAGCSHTVALFSRGAVLAWGQGTDGQLGNGATASSDTPVGVLLPAGAKIAAIGASCLDSLARTIKGHVLAWGNGSLGQLGDGSTSSSDTPARVDLPAGLRAAAIGAGPGAETLFAITHQA
jgi:alpha-tubulin suppressor-like RCC1 family protein